MPELHATPNALHPNALHPNALHADGAAAPITAIDEGKGPTLLVVHPGGNDATSWNSVARSLADHFRVVRIRRRIYVARAAIPASHSMAVEAADILAIAALLPPPIVLVGHSSGAVAALEAALRSPATFAALILYEPPLPTRAPIGGAGQQRARAALAAGDLAEAVKIHLHDVVQLPAALIDPLFANPAARAIFAAHAAAQLADTDAIDALGVGITRYASLSLPTTLIEGDASPPHLRQRLADLAATLPSARVITLPGQGHIAHVTAPALLADTIRDAAERNSSR
jgi:pimeloyl-ACP methyl ester carboxylesterase